MINKTTTGILILGLSLSKIASAEFQIVQTEAAQYTTKIGENVTIPIMYSTDTDDSNLSGLGLRIHWDSSKLTFDTLSNILDTEILQIGQVEDDVNNDDNDPNTDKVILIAWAKFGTPNWPGKTLPTKLYDIIFTANSTLAKTITTPVNFSSSSLSATYSFQSTPGSVVIEAPTPEPVPEPVPEP
ncbi:MAG: hypothetical protein KAU26_10030, partial [Methylococcales bacterium]|nr:hypothetical protein [Methylococcales bacterium]